MTMPSEIDAIFITAAGGAEVLLKRCIAMPTVADDEVLIEVHAAGINRHDVNQRKRGPTDAHSNIPGLEVSGRIVAVGSNVPATRVGEKVCALVDGGGYAQYVASPSSLALPVPEGLDYIQAACIPEAAFTVWHNFFGVAGMQAGEAAFFHGGTSGVGTVGIQMLKALGHPVFATCGSDEKMAEARRLGADLAVNYHDEHWYQHVLDFTDGRGVDVILDMSGAKHSDNDVKVLARRGRIVHLAIGPSGEFRAPLRAIMAKELKVSGSLLRPLPVDEKAVIAQQLIKSVWPHIEARKVQPVIAHTFTLDQASDAHAQMEQGNHMGKIVLDILGDSKR